MADVTYVSHVKLESAEGKIRWAYGAARRPSQFPSEATAR